MINLDIVTNLYRNKYGKYLLIKMFKILPIDDKNLMRSQLIEKKGDIKDKKKIIILLNIINKTDV